MDKIEMNSYRTVDGKQLRRGWTTGTCAAAAAKAAVIALLGGEAPPEVEIQTPAGLTLNLRPEDPRFEKDWASCAVRKDAGDDPDCTNGILVYAKAEKGRPGEEGIIIDGGEGIGRITKPGLDAPVGAAAINSTPLRMIRECVEEAAGRFDRPGPLRLTISIPGGEALAQKTFNPMLGIVGGLSILGTTGIVEPMSDEGYTGAIRAGLSMLRAMGESGAVITPGNYGMAFIENCGADMRNKDGLMEKFRALISRPGFSPVKCGNYIGETLDIAAEFGFSRLLLVGHIGKLMKLAAGNFNTHSRYGDGRREIFAAFAGAEGADTNTIRALLDCATSEAALDLLRDAGILEPTLTRLLAAIAGRLERRQNIETGAVFFSLKHGFLGMTETAQRLLLRWFA
jgi:cobalt-precorrin-5B (C1)-methyltransferase